MARTMASDEVFYRAVVVAEFIGPNDPDTRWPKEIGSKRTAIYGPYSGKGQARTQATREVKMYDRYWKGYKILRADVEECTPVWIKV